jgi:lipopolysaccharide transport system ATP-binding protein
MMKSQSGSTESRAQAPLDAPGEVLVRVEGVSKKFCRSLKRSLWYGLVDMAGEVNVFGRRGGRDEGGADAELRPGEFWAVRGVSFELRRGECLGLIGRNGAGKTTLLKMLNGLIKPDGGSITMRGRVGALIALGTGFNPILTGRENVYVNGSILGLTKEEIDRKIEGIIEFAEIGEFIDAPVQSYSSGMQVRLGFAVATAMEPDVLILDEVLAVGDAAFQAKCMQRVSTILEKAAVIFVSHQHHLVTRICDRAIWLRNGVIEESGATNMVLQRYLDKQSGGAAGVRTTIQSEAAIRSIDVAIRNETVESGGELELQLEIEVTREVMLETFFLMMIDESGEAVARATIRREILMRPGRVNRFSLIVGDVRLRPARYQVDLIVHRDGEKLRVFDVLAAAFFTSRSAIYSMIPYQPAGRLEEEGEGAGKISRN